MCGPLLTDHGPTRRRSLTATGKREVDEDTLEMPAGGKVARRVAVGGANRKRNHLFDIAGMLVRKSVRSYKFWLAVGLVTGLIVYYAWRR